MRANHSRRELLLASSAIAFSSVFAPKSISRAQSRYAFDRPLTIPLLDEGKQLDERREFVLNLQNGQTSFLDNTRTETSGINGSYLGPVLRMRSGDTVQMRVTNGLGHDTTLHWHGINLPAQADGGPHQIIKADETWTPEFAIHEAASTMWYHAHMLHETAAQVWSGLAGMILIDDDAADALNLPDEYGVNDIPVVLQDRRFYRDGSMPYEVSMHDEMAGMIGNIPLVNGTVLPFLQVKTEKLRLRLLNGSNASIYNLRFSDSRRFVQIASDGGLLSEPVALSSLRLAPGERAEIVVDFDGDEIVHLQSVGTSAHFGRGMGMMMAEQSPEFDLMEFRVGSNLQPSFAIPQKLADLPAVSEKDAVRTRKFLLEMPGMGPMRMLGMGGGFTINGRSMDLNRIDEVVKKGETEIWEIQNAGPMIHPFHIHNTQFRILDRNGQSPMANENGLKDTVVVDPDEVVRVLIRFDNYTDADRPYMYHCHILEHEDAGMMGQFTVV